MIYTMSVDVHAHWSEDHPIYRIYVDNDMLVERSFTWPSYQVYLTEHFVCELENGAHTLKIVNCNKSGTLEFKNFILEGKKVMLPSADQNTKWVFATDNRLYMSPKEIAELQAEQRRMRLEHERQVREQAR
jgi:hypothetical protein